MSLSYGEGTWAHDTLWLTRADFDAVAPPLSAVEPPPQAPDVTLPYDVAAWIVGHLQFDLALHPEEAGEANVSKYLDALTEACGAAAGAMKEGSA